MGVGQNDALLSALKAACAIGLSEEAMAKLSQMKLSCF